VLPHARFFPPPRSRRCGPHAGVTGRVEDAFLGLGVAFAARGEDAGEGGSKEGEEGWEEGDTHFGLGQGSGEGKEGIEIWIGWW
jgi:hypothetical protein